MERSVHLISDSPGQAVRSVANFVLARFPSYEWKYYNWPLIRDLNSLNRCFEKITTKPGIVLYTSLKKELKNKLHEFCASKNLLCISIVENVITDIEQYLNIQAIPASEIHFDESYFSKLEAIDFTLRHDDGNMLHEIVEADIILIGPSRSSKTPTSVYLAYNGFKTANIPYVKDSGLPSMLNDIQGPLIVGLIINPVRLMEIRINRMHQLQIGLSEDYTNLDAIKEECQEVRKICMQNHWPLIDVSLKSIEETAAIVMKTYYERK